MTASPPKTQPPVAASWPAALIVLGTLAVYGNSLGAPFVFDDVPAILENPGIRTLTGFLHPENAPNPAAAVVGRPVVSLSFALNYALTGFRPESFRLTNVLIHIAAALLLWGILRRTLRRPMLPGWLRTAAEPVALSAALLWSLHPLQTESVTCIVQRTESLAGLAYLAALYAFVRATEPGATAPWRWLAAAGGAAYVGIATKETVATLPLIVLLFDRTFAAGSFAGAWRERRAFHVLMFLSWLPLAWLMWQTQGRGGTATLGGEVNAWQSLLTQSRAVVMYLQLAVWPHPLVVDYGDYLHETVDRLGQVAPQFFGLTLLGLAVLWALVKRPVAGFVGAWFFVILAPSSSFVPLLSQMRAEHRMYLPLAAVVVAAAAGLWRLNGRAAVWLAGLWAVALGAATVARNHDYRTELALWTDTVAKAPGNARARHNLGLNLAQAGDREGALREQAEAIRLNPQYVDAHLARAALLLEAGRLAEAREHIAAAIRHGPVGANAHNNLGHVLMLSGDHALAAEVFEDAVRLDPKNHEAHNNLGYCLAAQGRLEEAIAHFRRSVELQPEATAYLNLGDALLKAGRADEGLASLEAALQLRPDLAEAHLSLANALAARRRYAEAKPHYEAVLQAAPDNMPAWFNLGIVQRRLGLIEAARASFRRVLELEPGNPRAAQQLEQLGGGGSAP